MSADSPFTAERWQNQPVSVFTQWTKIANFTGALNLAQGFPDFEGPEEIKAAVISEPLGFDLMTEG